MPIYEFYCPNNHKIYQFYAKTLAQGRTVPRCPDHPDFRMEKLISPFAVVEKGKKGGGDSEGAVSSPGLDAPGAEEDPRLDAAMTAMEGEFAHVDENDPRAMGRMMRRMAELTGEKVDGEMEEVVRKLEEGADPESLEEQLGGGTPEDGDSGEGGPGEPSGTGDPGERRRRLRPRRGLPLRDPKLYDY